MHYDVRIYTYNAPWVIFGLAWSQRPDTKDRLAIGSFIEEYTNKIQIVQKVDNKLEKKAEFNHPYPATKIMWSPAKDLTRKDRLATTGDYLRIWQVEANEGTVVEPPTLLNNNSKSEYCAPLTSFDWNETDPSIIGTSSIDTTCTIWDVEVGKATTQLIAHDKEVYDIAFSQNKHMFASVGADGSVRLFDLRNLEHSTIT